MAALLKAGCQTRPWRSLRCCHVLRRPWLRRHKAHGSGTPTMLWVGSVLCDSITQLAAFQMLPMWYCCVCMQPEITLTSVSDHRSHTDQPNTTHTLCLAHALASQVAQFQLRSRTLQHRSVMPPFSTWQKSGCMTRLARKSPTTHSAFGCHPTPQTVTWRHCAMMGSCQLWCATAIISGICSRASRSTLHAPLGACRVWRLSIGRTVAGSA